MLLLEFDMNFTFRGQKMCATCQKMKVYNYPHIRVAVHKEKGRADIFIFHEINEPNKKYFWYELSGIKEDMAKIISGKLSEVQEQNTVTKVQKKLI